MFIGTDRVLLFAAAVCFFTPVLAAANELAPPQAAAAGYTVNTFHSVFSKATIDLADTRAPGFQWYLGRFFSYPPMKADGLLLGANGSLTVTGTGYKNYGISTAAPTKKGVGWVGVAFGGGAYVEAVLKFDPSDHVVPGREGWPSFWSMAIEHLASLPGEQWVGQPRGLSHFIEVDLFEYDLVPHLPANYYGAAMHDYFGEYRISLSYSDIQMNTPETTDFKAFHRYGYLWTPATDAKRGLGQFFFDGKPIGRAIEWDKYAGQAPSTTRQPWTFGVIDANHLALILGTGVNQPMTVASVNVWQSSSKGNITSE